MIGIVIVAHGGLAREYLAAIEHVIGKQKGVCTVSIEANYDKKTKEEEICIAANSVDIGSGVVVVTDMFGGSPSNLSLPACLVQDRVILYGVNLPALLKLAKSRSYPIAEAVSRARNAGRQYINSYDAGQT